jgi:hypothetical protein
MDRTLGARIRAHREERQITLGAVAAETKIKLAMLEGLENDDVSTWPEAIYRRAYVRAYARVVGLDPEVLVRAFLEAHPEPVVAPPPEPTELENPAWPSEIRRLFNTARAAVPARRADVATTTSETCASMPTPANAHAESAHASPNIEAVHNETIAAQTREPNLVQAADVCTRLSAALHPNAIRAVLEDAVSALGAAGLMVWSWNAYKGAMTPWIAHGYPEALLAAMPCIPPDSDNGIAVAFRSMEACVIARGENVTGAVIVPIVSLGECLGILALELADGREESNAVRAFAALLAGHLVPHLSAAPLAAAVSA